MVLRRCTESSTTHLLDDRQDLEWQMHYLLSLDIVTVREALIQFFVNASGAMKEAYCFTVRGRHNEMSLSTFMFWAK